MTTVVFVLFFEVGELAFSPKNDLREGRWVVQEQVGIVGGMGPSTRMRGWPRDAHRCSIHKTRGEGSVRGTRHGGWGRRSCRSFPMIPFVMSVKELQGHGL